MAVIIRGVKTNGMKWSCRGQDTVSCHQTLASIEASTNLFLSVPNFSNSSVGPSNRANNQDRYFVSLFHVQCNKLNKYQTYTRSQERIEFLYSIILCFRTISKQKRRINPKLFIFFSILIVSNSPVLRCSSQ